MHTNFITFSLFITLLSLHGANTLELITNGSFENGLPPWSAEEVGGIGGMTLIGTGIIPPYDGAHMFQWNNNGNFTYFWQTVNLPVGGNAILSFAYMSQVSFSVDIKIYLDVTNNYTGANHIGHYVGGGPAMSWLLITIDLGSSYCDGNNHVLNTRINTTSQNLISGADAFSLIWTPVPSPTTSRSPTPTSSITPSTTPSPSVSPTSIPTSSITPTTTPTSSLSPSVTSTPTSTPKEEITLQDQSSMPVEIVAPVAAGGSSITIVAVAGIIFFRKKWIMKLLGRDKTDDSDTTTDEDQSDIDEDIKIVIETSQSLSQQSSTPVSIEPITSHYQT